MHAVVMESLEEWLAGSLAPAAQREMEAHLDACEACREEVVGMHDVSDLFHSFQSEAILEPDPGFYVRLMEQVREKQSPPAFTGLFSLDFSFGRRVVFACLMMLAVLGTCLVSRETSHAAGISPETILAQENSPAFDSRPAQDNMLVTLTAYEH